MTRERERTRDFARFYVRRKKT